MNIETPFPRGGHKTPLKSGDSPKIRRDFNLFKGDRSKVKQKDETVSPKNTVATADFLSNKTVQEGIVTIGYVEQINQKSINLQLPGMVMGTVMISHISTQYNQLLKMIAEDIEPEDFKTHHELFHPGQCVATKVIRVDVSQDNHKLELSLLPEDINAQFVHTSLVEGMILWGAISGCEEHGYVVDLGIQNCRAFLKKTFVDEGKEYGVGEVLWVVVQTCETSPTASVLNLNAKINKISNTLLTQELHLDHIRPGMQMEFCIEKILSNGFEGTVLNNLTGYIHEAQLPAVMEQLEDYSVKEDIIARVLYVIPIRKLLYLTMRSIEPYDREHIHDGAIMDCKILSTTKEGLYLQLTEQDKGFVSYRSLRTTLEDLDGEIYCKGSNHKCRVLNFDYCDRVYMCSFEENLLNPMVFSLKDLKVGETVSGTIKEIKSHGVVVQIGRVTGFISNAHLSDMGNELPTNFKSKLKQPINAKVWVINEETHSLYLTIKPTLMTSEKILTTYEDAIIGKQFPGVITQISAKGLRIQFFGNIYGFISRDQISLERIDKLTDMFHIGKVVVCTVLKCNLDAKHIDLTLLSRAINDKTKLPLGKHVSAVVTKVSEAGVEVVIEDSTTAIIPLLHLTKFTSLALLLAATYNVGDKIPDLVCVCNRDIPILSLRELQLKTRNIPNINDLKVGQLLSCSVQCVTDDCMSLQSPIIGFGDFINIPSESILSYGDIKTIDIKQHQSMIAKICEITMESEIRIDGSTKLFDLWADDLNFGVQLLSEYLADIQQIKNNFNALDNPLGYLNLGEIVKGVIQDEVESGSYIIHLENGAIGYAKAEHCSRLYEIGEEVTGVILWLNFINEHAEISLIPRHMKLINKKQNDQTNINNDICNSDVNAEVLLVKEDFVLLVLGGGIGNKQFVFLSIRLHINDLTPNPSYYIDSMGKQIKINIKRIENGFILGVPKEPLNNIIHHTKKTMICTGDSESYSDSENIHIDTTKKSRNKKENKQKVTNNEAEAVNAVVSDTELEDITEEINIKHNKKDKKRKSKTLNEETSAKHQKLEHPEDIKHKYVKPVLSGTCNSWNITDLEVVQKEEINKLNKEKKNNKAVETKVKTKKKTKNAVVSDTELEDITEEINMKKNKKDKKRKSKTLSEEPNEYKQNHIEPVHEKEATMDTSVKTKIKKEIRSVVNGTELEDVTDEINKKKKKKDKKRKSKIQNEEISAKNIKLEPIEEEVNIQQKKNNDDILKTTVKTELVEETNIKKNKKNKRKSTTQIEETEELKQNHFEPVLSGASNFWTVPVHEVVQEESSGDEEEVNTLSKQQKKKKLTPAERAEFARIEEERIRKIETELADLDTVPKTADQFDRLVMANPNNSENWINYMAFHLEATEIEKAKAVARRALTIIEFREEQEKLNVWIAFLNLENRYGTKESFTAALEEATQLNDSLVVYLQALHILSESKKTTDFIELLRIVSRKFKQSFKMWTGAAEACYKCDLKDQARNLMQRSLQSLNEKEHVNLLVQFAFMEARFNDPERAEALLEKILASYPRRVDVWTSYVDLLIKGNRINIARNVLERAIGQKLPARKMKTIFTKYLQFETKYGDDESVLKVRKQAAAYVKTALK